jgi:hypothetical protein
MMLHVEFVGGIYDGEVATMPARCKGCGQPFARSGGAIVSPEGTLYLLERVWGDQAKAVYAGNAEQFTLDELLFGDNGDAA